MKRSNKNILNAVRTLLGVQTSLSEAKTSDGLTIKADSWEVGSACFIVKEDGTEEVAADNTYELEDKTKVTVVDGLITEMVKPEETPVEEKKEEVSDETKKTEVAASKVVKMSAYATTKEGKTIMTPDEVFSVNSAVFTTEYADGMYVTTPASADITLADGSTYKIVEGRISEILAPVSVAPVEQTKEEVKAESETLEALKALEEKLSALETENEALKTKNAELSKLSPAKKTIVTPEVEKTNLSKVEKKRSTLYDALEKKNIFKQEQK